MPTNPASLAVTDAYRQRMLNIRREGERAARAVWGDVDPADLMGTYLVAPLATAVSALQRTGVLLSSAYVKAFIKSEIGKDILIPTPRGFTGTSFADVEIRAALLRPVVLVKKLEAQGVPEGKAMMRGRNVLLRTVALATDSAVRDSLTKLYEKRPEVVGWQRAVAGTCDKCIGKADGSTLAAGTPLDIHPNCECVSEGVVRTSDLKADFKPALGSDQLDTARRIIQQRPAFEKLRSDAKVLVYHGTGGASANVGQRLDTTYVTLNQQLARGYALGKEPVVLIVRKGDLQLPPESKAAGFKDATDSLFSAGEAAVSRGKTGLRLVGQDHFDAMTKDEQDATFGPDVAAALRAGTIDLSDLVTTKDGFLVRRPLDELNL